MKALDVISRVAMPQQIAEIARPIALRHHVNELYLFGSMARGGGAYGFGYRFHLSV